MSPLRWPAFRQHKFEQEPVIDQMLALNANDGEPLAYNANFTIKELKTALSKKKSTAPGGDTVHYPGIKANCRHSGKKVP